MLWSDIIGALGGVLLALPPIKDQYLRFSREHQKRLASESPLPAFRNLLSTAWEERRNEYDGRDSICLAVGGVGLVFAFALKMFEA
jgi:hypothetical protein